MLNIAVCDDDERIINRMEQFINAFVAENQLNCSIYKFSDGRELLDSPQQFDLIFLDIEMKTIDGIETGKMLREIDKRVYIVYITSYTDYWRNAYKIHAFDFIPKPFSAKDINTVLADFVTASSESDMKSIVLKTDKGEVVENANKIYYFIIQDKRKVEVCTAYRSYIIKENLSSIFARLDSEQFYMSHKSCIVNMKYVESMRRNDGIVMKNGVWLPLAQKKQKEFYFMLSKQLRESYY